MRSKSFSLFLLIIMLIGAACTPQATPAVPTQAPATVPAAQDTPAPAAPAASKEVTILAAASLTESFIEIGQIFEAKNPGTKVMFNFAGSQQLAQQLEQGAPADVFASASKKYMEAAITAGRVGADSAKNFVYNRLVVIFPKDNPAGLKELKDLAKSGLKLDLADKAVPVGQYSLDFLDKAIQDPTFGASFKDDVLKNVVSYEENVKAVLTKVVLGEADAGIVYLSDISQDAAEKVGKLDIPVELNVIATYPIAAIQDSPNPDPAKGFIELVLSQEGQQVLGKYNFIPADQKPEPAPTPTPFTVTDALERTVTFQKLPQRIALAGKANLLIADALYMFPQAANRTGVLGKGTQGTGNFLAVIDQNYEDKPKLENQVGPEQIAAENPDVVVLKSYLSEDLGKPLEILGIPVIYLDFETPEQYTRDLKTLGQLFQDEARGAEVAQFYQSRIDQIKQATSSLSDADKPKTLLLYYSDKDGEVAFNVPPMGWIQTMMVEISGGLPVWKDANLGKGWTKVSLEQVAAWDPDQIFIISYIKPVNEVVEGLKADPQWQALRATKDSKLYGFASDFLSWDQADTRWILGLTWLAGKLHPELFPGLDIIKEAQAFYQELYGLDEAKFKESIQPLMSGDLP